MLKLITITMQLDTLTQKISNIRTTIKDINTIIESDPIAILNENTLEFNQVALELLGAVPGDRIEIAWVYIENKFKPVVFKSETRGNLLSKNNRIICKGTTSKDLGKIANKFYIVPFEDMFLLVTEDEYSFPESDDLNDLTKIDLENYNINNLDDDNFQINMLDSKI